MKSLKPREIEVPDDDPFRNDAFGTRRQTAETLTTFVRNVSTPYVLAIDSPWGTGKTTFLRMWLQHLRNEGVPCLLFNAWQADHVEDPFVPLVSALQDALAEDSAARSRKVATTLDSLRAKASRFLSATAPIVLPAAAGLLTGGLLANLNPSTATGEDAVRTAATGIVEGMVSKQLEDYQQSRDAISEFRKELEEFAKSLGDGTPLVILIDELDRCRPTFAVRLLERVKHLFDVPGIVFVFALDRTQIVHTVCSLYGSGFGADGYLRRFFNLTYRLPDPPPDKYAEHLLATLGIAEFFESRKARQQDSSVSLTRDKEHDELRKFVSFLFRIAKLSLREQEQCLARILVALYMVPEKDWTFPEELSTLAVLREWQPALYEEFAHGATGPDEVAAFFREKGDHGPDDSWMLAQVEAVLIAGSESMRKASTRLAEHERTISDEGKPEAERQYAAKVREHMRWAQHRDRHRFALPRSIERLSLAAPFSSDWLERGEQ